MRWLILSAVVALSFACTPRTVDGGGGCERDGDCANFEFCQVDTGLCLCADSNACDATEFCNDQGRCQAQSGCDDNEACFREGENRICDTASGECVTLTGSLQCTLGSHCPFGSYCEGNACLAGCRENGDCQLGDPCIDGQCDPTPGACNANGYCEFGQLCDTDTNRCVDHPERSSLCEICDASSLTPCTNGGPCLIDSSIPPDACTVDADCAQYDAICRPGPPLQCAGDDSVCGPNGSCGFLSGLCNCGAFGGECPAGTTCDNASGFCTAGGQCGRNFCGSNACDDETNPCPRGYSCFTLVTVTGQACTAGDGTCQGGRACQIGGENENAGFCSCIQDSDCGGFGTTCVNPGPNGSCVTGTTCGPQQGLLCEDLE